MEYRLTNQKFCNENNKIKETAHISYICDNCYTILHLFFSGQFRLMSGVDGLLGCEGKLR